MLTRKNIFKWFNISVHESLDRCGLNLLQGVSVAIILFYFFFLRPRVIKKLNNLSIHDIVSSTLGRYEANPVL